MVASTNSGAKSGTCVGWIVFINSASACPGTLFSHSFCMKRCLLTSRHQLSTVAAAGVSENETTHMHSTRHYLGCSTYVGRSLFEQRNVRMSDHHFLSRRFPKPSQS